MNRIREYRKRMGISQQKLAEILEVHQTAVSQWETGRTSPDLGLAAEMARLFGVPLGELLGMTGTEKGDGMTAENGAVRLPVRETADAEPAEGGEAVYIPAETAQSGGYIAVRIRGNSMHPRIQDGDIVIVCLRSDVEDGDVALVCANGETVCRKVKKTPTGCFLLPFNPDCEALYYPPLPENNGASGGEELPFAVIGKVVGLHARF